MVEKTTNNRKFPMQKMNRLAIILSLIAIVAVFLFALFENRYFFQFNNRWFTIWDTKDGCYIILDKYKSLLFPKRNYVIIDSKIDIKIFVDDKDIYHLFSHNCSNGYSPKANFTAIDFVIHPYETKESNYKNMEFYETNKFPYFRYEALTNWGHVKEKQSCEQEILTYDLKWILQRFFLGAIYFAGSKN